MLNRFLKTILFTLLLNVAPAHAAPVNSLNPQSILNAVNAHRVKQGLAPLKMMTDISAEAKIHSQDMATGKAPFGHTGFSERAHHLFKEFQPAHGAAENVAYLYRASDDVVTLWLNSSGHRRNIEGRYNLTGIGIARNADGRIYVTQIFVNQDGTQTAARHHCHGHCHCHHHSGGVYAVLDKVGHGLRSIRAAL